MTNINHFIVENAGNTCYIDSILTALFYNNTSIESMLKNDIKSENTIYLQEFIKINFIENIRNNKSIDKETMKDLKELCFKNNWRLNDADEYDKQQDVTEFYTFLLELFEEKMIDTQRNTYTEGLPDKSDIGNIETMPYIPLSIPNNCKVTSVKEMFNNWLYDNTTEVKRYTEDEKSEKGNLKDVRGLNIYSIINVPNLIGLSVNRFVDVNERINADIIIQKKIKPFVNQIEIPIYEYKFHSAVCHIGTSSKSGHYYTFLSIDDSWYFFDDLEKPCFREVDITDKQITSKIKKECVFLIYKLI